MSENPSQATASSPSDPNFSEQPWHRIDGDPAVDVFAGDAQNTPVPEICSATAPFPDQYLSCCQPKGHVGSHEYPPRPASAVDRFWRCPRCSRTGRFPVMEEESTERLVALVQHARAVHADGDSCTCEHFTFSDTPADPVANQRLGRAMAATPIASRMCARCTVLFTPTTISAKFCESCELSATRGGVSRLPKDVVAAAAHLPAELAHSTDRIAALQKRCDLQSRMHREQVVLIRNLEQKIADLLCAMMKESRDDLREHVDQFHDVVYPKLSVWFWVKIVLIVAISGALVLWALGVLP